MSAMPTNDAWDIAKSHPLIVNLDYDELLILSKVYNQQKVTFNSAAKISEVFLSPDFNSLDKAKMNIKIFKSQMQEIVAREFQLLEYYNQANKIFKVQNKWKYVWILIFFLFNNIFNSTHQSRF